MSKNSKIRRAIKRVFTARALLSPDFTRVAEEELGKVLRNRVLQMTGIRAKALKADWDNQRPGEPVDVESSLFDELVAKYELNNQVMFQQAAQQLSAELRSKGSAQEARLAEIVDTIISRTNAATKEVSSDKSK